MSIKINTRKIRKFLASLLTAFFLFSFALQAFAANITVNSLTDNNTGCELRGAINSSNLNSDQDGCTGVGVYGVDNIDFSTGPGTIILTSGAELPLITDPVTINGYVNNDDMPDITLDGDPDGDNLANIRILDVGSPDVTVKGFNFLHGGNDGPSGPGGSIVVRTASDLTLLNSTIDQSNGTFGGSIGVESDAKLKMDGVDITNTSGKTGGAIYLEPELNNNPDTYDLNLDIDHTTIQDTQAILGDGGAIYIGENNEAKIVHTTIGDTDTLNPPVHTSKANHKGGAIYHAGETTPPPVDTTDLELDEVNINNSDANLSGAGDEGGALYLGPNMETVLDGFNVLNNNTAQLGGGIFVGTGGSLTMSLGNQIINSTAEHGGGIYMDTGSHLQINGLSGNPVIIQANHANTSGGGLYMVPYGSDAVISNASFEENNSSENGGAIQIGSGNTINLTDTNFSFNEAGTSGGGIYSTDDFSPGDDKIITINGSTIGDNQADSGGFFYAGNYSHLDLNNVTTTAADPNISLNGDGGFLNMGSSGIVNSLQINNSQISGNRAQGTLYGPGSCGALAIGSNVLAPTPDLRLLNTTFEDNTAVNFGGAICLNRGSELIDNSQFINNQSGLQGGAIFLDDNSSDSSTTIQNGSVFSGNIASSNLGGAIYISQNANQNSVNINDSSFNVTGAPNSMFSGGAIYNQGGTLIVDHGSFSSDNTNVVDYGGAIFTNTGSTTIQNSNIFNFTVNQNGGAIFNNNGSVSIADSNIYNNTANGINVADGGGAIFTEGANLFNIFTSYLGNNQAEHGGAIYVDSGDFGLTNSTLDSNTANTGGGGLFISNTSGNVTVDSATIAYNSTTGTGGGIYNDTAAPINITNTILSNNTATVSGPDCHSVGALSTNGFNLFSDTSDCGGAFQPGDILDTDAQLGFLGYFGGPTQSYILLGNSPAINTGNTSQIIDQTGASRPQGVADDIGSNEFQDHIAPVISEVTPVPTPTADTTPDYTFTTSEGGNITYGGGCSSATTNTNFGPVTITFNTLAPGTYSLCTIRVTDFFGNLSNLLNVTSFTITAPVIPPANPPSSGGGGAGNVGGFGQPACSGSACSGGPTTTTPPANPPTNPPVNLPTEPTGNPTTPVENPPVANPPATTPTTTPSANPPTNPPVSNPPASNPTTTPSTPITTPVDNSTVPTTDSGTPNNSTNTPVTPVLNFPTGLISTPQIYLEAKALDPFASSLTCNYDNFQKTYNLSSIDINQDTDGDGLSDRVECQVGSNPTLIDSDSDGKPDSEEVLGYGTNPNKHDDFNPNNVENKFVIVTLPADQLKTADDSPVFLGLSNPEKPVDLYLFTSSTFDPIRAKIQAALDANLSLSTEERSAQFTEQFSNAVANILQKFLNHQLDPQSVDDAPFIDQIKALGHAQTDQNGLFALDTDLSLRDNQYLVMGVSRDAYSEPVQFAIDSSLQFLTPQLDTLGGKNISAEAIAGHAVIDLDNGSTKPALTGEVKAPGRIVAIWQSNIVSSALLADTLGQEFRLTPPKDLEPGEHTVILTAYRGSDNAQSKSIKLRFNVHAGVPNTMFNWWPYALAFLLSGLLLILVMRRRNNSPEAQKIAAMMPKSISGNSPAPTPVASSTSLNTAMNTAPAAIVVTTPATEKSVAPKSPAQPQIHHNPPIHQGQNDGIADDPIILPHQK